MPDTQSLMAMSNDKPRINTAPPDPADGLKEWSTTKELCAWLGVDPRHLYYLVARGEGPRRHRLGDVERWLETRAVE
jgi:hypothetical protein